MSRTRWSCPHCSNENETEGDALYLSVECLHCETPVTIEPGLVLDLVDYSPLWAWMRARERARRHKESGLPPPHTTDPVIAAYRFCNVRREDDRVTAWIRENIREPFADHPYLWFMLCVARQINWPATLSELMGTRGAWPGDAGAFQPRYMTLILNDRKARGNKVYTGAYMISAPSVRGTDKQEYIAETVCGDLWNRRDQIGPYLLGRPTLQGVHGMLRKSRGWGPFMAYQAVVDMRFTRLLARAPDVSTWAAAGPGTIRGLNRVHGRPVKASLPQARALEEMRNIWWAAALETGIEFDFSDVPNTLCETDKWLRVQNGEGKPRALYVPGRGC